MNAIIFRIASFAVVAATLSQAAAASRAFTLADFEKIVTVSDVQIAPIGGRIAFIVQRADMTKAKFISRLALLDIATGETRDLTPNSDDVSTPRWSPDGARLAFIAPQSGSPKAKPQIWILPMDGGEASLLTHASNGVETYAWRHDGKVLVFQSPDDPANKAAIDKNRDLFTVRDQDYLSQSAPVASHIWIQSLDGGKAQRITSGSWSLPSGNFTNALSWSSDGKYIAF
jgi:dipeptidyl aminopeptidase/acylaminoacyl peptidase